MVEIRTAEHWHREYFGALLPDEMGGVCNKFQRKVQGQRPIFDPTGEADLLSKILSGFRPGGHLIAIWNR
jgi:hypothetical protein